MIRNLLVHDNQLQDIFAILGALAFTLMVQQMTAVKDKYIPLLLVATGAWGIFGVWVQITVHEGWKVLSDEDMITKRLITQNGTHLYIPGDSSFTRGCISYSI